MPVDVELLSKSKGEVSKDASRILAQNWNLFASSLMVEVCLRQGSDTFFVSPGYRDAPFIAALQAHPEAKVVSCIDERAGAFQALGWSKAKGRPAVLLCTSGTAGANYLPAVIEAHVDHVPLLVITADRPFELVHASAQQVIDQRDLFGRFVKKSLDFPTPSPQLNPRAWISYLRMLIDTATEDRKGPVHINLPFHTPLDPVETLDKPSEAFVQKTLDSLRAMHFEARAPLVPAWNPERLEDFRASIDGAKRGLLILGRLDGSDEVRRAVSRLGEILNWPVFADISSGLKFSWPIEILDLTIPASRKLLDEYAPDCVIHIGKRLVSRHFDDALSRWPEADYWVLTDEDQVQDPYHLPKRRQARANLSELSSVLSPKSIDETWAKRFHGLTKLIDQVESPSFNFRDVAGVIRNHEKGKSHLFLGNSTAIRAFDSWCYGRGESLSIEANRGVSGIEGLLATTMGLSLASASTWTLVIGDISLLHDLNSLIALGQSEAKVIVVLVNNSGGRIFETLPVGQYAWVKDPFISTPHSLNFEGAAAMARLPYSVARSREDFVRIFEERQALGTSCIIECQQEAEADLKYVRALKAQEYSYE